MAQADVEAFLLLVETVWKDAFFSVLEKRKERINHRLWHYNITHTYPPSLKNKEKYFLMTRIYFI